MLEMAIGIVIGGANFTDLLMVLQAGDPATPYATLALRKPPRFHRNGRPRIPWPAAVWPSVQDDRRFQRSVDARLRFSQVGPRHAINAITAKRCTEPARQFGQLKPGERRGVSRNGL